MKKLSQREIKKYTEAYETSGAGFAFDWAYRMGFFDGKIEQLIKEIKEIKARKK